MPEIQDAPQKLLDPNTVSDVKVEMYQVHLGTVEKGQGPETTLSVQPHVVFRATRVMVSARIIVKVPFWITLLSWIVIPWVFVNWDEIDPDETWWRQVYYCWHLWFKRPLDLRMAHHAKKHREALKGCTLASLKLHNMDCLVSEIPLSVFYYGEAPEIGLPTATPQTVITAIFRGVAGCTFDVSLTGFAIKDTQ